MWIALISDAFMGNDYLSSPQSYRIQKTIRSAVRLKGIGLHTGEPSSLKIHPAEPNHGIVFLKTDLRKPAKILAHFDAVTCTAMATTLGFNDLPEARVRTVEHIMAALYAMGITNVLIEMTGPEIPILDGSAAPFVEAILDAGIDLQHFSQPVLRVTRPIKVNQKGAVCELLPRDRLRLTTSVDFSHPNIGLQTFALELTPQRFIDDIGSARTFGFVKDVERLKQMKLALGASLENVLAFSEDAIVNPEGARFLDECVRHKLLDAIGDLALCGCWIEGELVSYRGGHSIHLALLQALKDFKNHWEILPATSLTPSILTKQQPSVLHPNRPIG